MVWKPPYVSPDPSGSPAPDAAPAPVSSVPDAAPASSGGGWKPPYTSPEPATTTQPPPSDQGDGTWSGFFHDFFHSPPADLSRPQTWRDWATRTYSPTASDWANASVDDLTLGAGDIARSAVTGEDLAATRARTERAQRALGPMAPIVNALTYVIPGMGEEKGAVGAAKLATPGGALSIAGKAAQPYVGRYGAAALEGAVQSGLSYTGHTAGGPDFNPLDLGVHTVTGAGVGAGSQAAADAANAAIVRRVSDFVSGKTGRAGEDWGIVPNLRTAPSQDVNDALDRGIADAQSRNDPALPALQNAKAAVNQSIEPGAMSRAVTYPTLGYTGGVLGAHFPGINETAGAITGLGLGEGAAKYIGEPIAKGVNQIDKNIAVNEALDRLYPYVTGQPRSTTNLAPFTQVVRQSAIANQRGPSDALNRYIITGHW